MPYCFVPLCQSGSKAKDKYLQENGLQKPRFFSPCNEEKRVLWESLIKRGDRAMTLDSRVCHEHFLIDDFDLYYETKLPDGTVDRQPRGKAKLKPEAVPSIFPKYPTYYQPKTTKRKQPAKRGSPRKKPKPISNNQPVNVPDIMITEDAPAEENIGLVEPVINLESSAETDRQNDENEWSCLHVHKLDKPIGWVVGNTLSTDRKFVVHIDPDTLQTDKTILFEENKQPVVKIRGVPCNYFTAPELTLVEMQKLVNKVDSARICAGTGIDRKKYSADCHGSVGNRRKSCTSCIAERERLRKMDLRKHKIVEKQEEKKKKIKTRIDGLRRSKLNLLNKIRMYRIKISNAIYECQQKKGDILKEAIAKLPPAQQEAVNACFEASKKKGPTGRRYTTEWVYECMLMRIKDKKLYNHIREHNILCLPCTSTINGYLKNYGGAYGFQPQVLEMLKKKTADMDIKLRRGVILIDEMKLTQGVYFDASTLQVLGFKDLGEDCHDALGEDFTESVDEALQKLPEDLKAGQKEKRREKRNEKNKHNRERNLGDHALVVSFQPFRGKWVQAIAAFLTRGNATDVELTRIVLEATILLERSGLLVDGVVGDGAAWNRSMWTKFGVTKEKPSAEHPCDESRRLWFISDFPHLLKCMRNCLCTKKIIKTPKGDVMLAHWQAILDAERLRAVGLRECHKLTQDHLNPNPWQKMNVRMAFQFWSASVAAAMESFQLQGVEKLDDCGATIEMVKLVNNMSDAMNSNRPENAMRLDSTQFEAIETFLTYFENLKKWADDRLHLKLVAAEKARVDMMRKQGKNARKKSEESLHQENYIFSDSTDIGLLVTLKGSMQLIKFLIEDCGFSYVMTARFNQDALERFFGLVRQSSGCNTHPEPRVFAQLFRLLSIYSLVKPCRGSNITGGEMVTTLLNLDDLKSKTRKEKQKALCDKLDEIVINGQDLEHISDVLEQVHHDHNYIDGESVDEFALSYVAGFVARYSKKYFKDCQECEKHLKKPESEKTDVDLLITSKSKGWLTYATDELINLLRVLEKKIIETSLNSELEENFIFIVLDNMQNVKVQQIGCEIHSSDLTKSVMKFFLMMRMHFLTRRWNVKTTELKKKQKGYRKQAHLT